MSIPNAALQKLLGEIEGRAVQSQQEINVVKTQIAAKQREIRLLELTSSEVSTLPTETKVYDGVGRMFVSRPIDDVDKRLKSDTSTLKTDIESLQKRLLYLETTHKNSTAQINKMLSGGLGSG